MLNVREDFYFVSIGEKSYFYTLNLSFIDIIYKKSGPLNKPFPVAVRKFKFIKNLSHDFETAQELAKQWVEENNPNFTLKLLSEPKAMSEREKGILAAYLARIEGGYLPFGKYINTHVSEVDKSYIHWVVQNLYDPSALEGKQNELAQICYNHAEKEGWIKEWLKEAADSLCPEGYSDQLNAIINGDVFQMGKYRGQSFADIAYTKKGTLKVAMENYLKWLSKSDTVVSRLVQNSDFDSVLDENDGFEYYNLESDHFKDCKGGKPDDFTLTVIMALNLRNKQRNEAKNTNAFPLYRFNWKTRQLSEAEALKLSKINRSV